MDLGVWLVLTGLIKIGPAIALVATREAATGRTYWVAGRALRRQLTLMTDGPAGASVTQPTQLQPVAVGS